ncbi:bifunctional DNA primase/polymerase [Actinomyces procaprae]|uniref:bifunctional DNA primase/polymerase n=1 Tax=Actinomyces procaprae TaxID=2560010 RepID=UPI001F02583F|nr:bifunctional DNA primase/polymerase [Actinomyces procaprae]
MAAHRAAKLLPGVPVEMIGRARWVRRDGKRPVTVDGAPASSTDPGTWSPLRRVLGSQTGFGVGFMLGGGIGCLDLDHCLDGDGRPSAFAQRVLDACPATYVEVSPSGTGLHVFGQLPEGPGRRLPGVEVYSRARFMTVTARPYKTSAAVLGDLAEVAHALTN